MTISQRGAVARNQKSLESNGRPTQLGSRALQEVRRTATSIPPVKKKKVAGRLYRQIGSFPWNTFAYQTAKLIAPIAAITAAARVREPRAARAMPRAMNGNRR